MIVDVVSAAAGFWCRIAAAREAAAAAGIALPAHPTAIAVLCAVAVAERTLPPARRYADGILPWLDEATRDPVLSVLREQGLLDDVDHPLALTDAGRAAAAAIGDDAGAPAFSDLPPMTEADEVVSIETGLDDVDPPVEDDREFAGFADDEIPEHVAAALPTAQPAPIIERPTTPIAEIGDTEPPRSRRRRTSSVKREPPGVPRM
jgi:hypothetical protein